MTAARPMRVAFATDIRRALRGIGPTYTKHVFIDVIAVHVMEVPIVQVIDVTIVANCRVSAIRAVLVVMMSVVGQVACGHEFLRFTRLAFTGARWRGPLHSAPDRKCAHRRGRKKCALPVAAA